MSETARRRISYPAILAGLFFLWPIVAYMGGQGFTAGVALAAIPVLFFARPRSVPLYAMVFIAFMAWTVVSSAWSSAGGGLFEGSFADNTFALNAASVRIGLTALCIGGVIFAATQVEPYAPRSLAIFKAIPAVQALGVVVTALFMGAILQALAFSSDPVTEMPQNMMRNVNALTLILPLLSVWLWTRGGLAYRAAAIVWPIAIAWAGLVIGSEAAVLAILLIGVASLIVWRFQRTGFLALFTALGAYIMLAPLIFGGLMQMLRGSGLPIPASFWSRVHAWDSVTDRVTDSALIGHGLEATKTWGETYRDEPARLAEIIADTGLPNAGWEAYSIVPGHPHNMALQIWAETGFVGALLAAVTCLLIGVRLYQLGPIPHIARYAGAGLFAAAFTYFAFSYSMWNEAFWASVALAAAVVILHGRYAADL
ncbi:MAG: O-antigen ligase family protein [Pseudomonadota bacterium]